jgi:hypothetical protein
MRRSMPAATALPEAVEKLSRLKQTPLSLSRLITFGERGGDVERGRKSALFLR